LRNEKFAGEVQTLKKISADEKFILEPQTFFKSSKIKKFTGET